MAEGYKFAYVRVSTKDQHPDRQIKMMLDIGVEERFIRVEKQSGKDFNREVYNNLKSMLRENDILYIESIDRLGRDYQGILDEWRDIRKNGVHIVALDNQELFDSRKFASMGEIGKLLENQMLNIFAYIAEEQRKTMLRRQAEGIEAAKIRGQKFGRPSAIQDEKKFKKIASEWVRNKITAVDAAKSLNMSKVSFYKYVKEYGYEKL